MRLVAAVLLLALSACATPGPAAPGTSPAPMASRPPPAAVTPPRPVRRQPDPTVPAAGAVTVWRVVVDGTTGCAEPAALRLLREERGGGAQALRRLAAARASGGCVTVFRAAGWRASEPGGPTIRLTPVEGGPPLHFWRDEVVEERPG